MREVSDCSLYASTWKGVCFYTGSLVEHACMDAQRRSARASEQQVEGHTRAANMQGREDQDEVAQLTRKYTEKIRRQVGVPQTTNICENDIICT